MDLRYDDDFVEAAVFIAAGSRAARRVVTTGIADGPRVEITSGVRAGELVITRGTLDTSVVHPREVFRAAIADDLPRTVEELSRLVRIPSIAFPDYDAQFWIPARFDAKFRTNRDQYFLQAVARLKGDVTIEQARAQLDTVMDVIRRDYPQFTQNARGGVMPMKDLLVRNVRTRLLILMGAVAFILLIACANMGNLLLARAAARRREIAVRHALGARPARLVRQLLTESLLLALIGGVAGLALGYLLIDALVAWLACLKAPLPSPPDPPPPRAPPYTRSRDRQEHRRLEDVQPRAQVPRRLPVSHVMAGTRAAVAERAEDGFLVLELLGHLDARRAGVAHVRRHVGVEHLGDDQHVVAAADRVGGREHRLQHAVGLAAGRLVRRRAVEAPAGQVREGLDLLDLDDLRLAAELLRRLRSIHPDVFRQNNHWGASLVGWDSLSQDWIITVSPIPLYWNGMRNFPMEIGSNVSFRIGREDGD